MNSSDDDRTPYLPACPRRASFTVAGLLALSSIIHADSPPVQLAANESQVVSLSNAYSQSDIARLRAQARGKGGNAYIAYPQLILNGRPDVIAVIGGIIIPAHHAAGADHPPIIEGA